MKIMVWNIEQFTNRKLVDHSRREATAIGFRTIYYDSTIALDYMAAVVTTDLPDVIAVLEVMAGDALNLGDPLPNHSPGADGLTGLLAQIQGWTGIADWRLVPPLKVRTVAAALQPAQHEVVGVFYNSATVEFKGPNNWTVAGSAAPGAGAAIAYPAPWNTAAITDATTKAGQLQFFDTAGAEIIFPNNYNRRPFLVDFEEKTGKKRLIRCAFMHTSPDTADDGTEALAGIQEFYGTASTDPSYVVVAGDFNVNMYKCGNPSPYSPLFRKGFSSGINNTGISDRDYNYSTSFTKLSDGSPFERFGYLRYSVLDNVLIRSRNKTLQKALLTTVMVPDTVAGQPTWTGGGYPVTMSKNLKHFRDKLADKTDKTPKPSLESTFRTIDNFGGIRQVSDHLAVYVNIH